VTVHVLPPIGNERVPAWRLTRNAVRVALAVVAIFVLGAVLTSLVVVATVTVEGEGVLEPVTTWPIRPIEGGVVARVDVRTGDTVHAGQPLIHLDATNAGSTVADLESQLAEAKIDLERLTQSAPIDRTRFQAVVDEADARVIATRAALRGAMVPFGVRGDVDSLARAAMHRTHVGLDAPSAELLAAEASAAQARAQLAALDLAPMDLDRRRAEVRRIAERLRAARLHLGRYVVRAPATGVVLTDRLDQMVGALAQPGQSLLDLAVLDAWHATLFVTQRDVHRIHIGDRADVELPALAGLPVDRFSGSVVYVGWEPDAASTKPTPTTEGYRVDVALSDSGEMRRLGGGVLRRGYVTHGRIAVRRGRIFELIVAFLREQKRGLGR
jgi:multidrug resistance efflux pump